MSEKCNNIARLNRDGTSRQQRLLNALLPENIAIDERKMKDLIAFARKLGKEINYYGIGNVPDGNWSAFLSETQDKDLEIIFNDHKTEDENYLEYIKRKSGYTEPHIALFLGFLKLFEIARNDLNLLTQKHIDYYYKDILKLKEKPAVADKVFLVFKLAKQIDAAHKLVKGTEFKADEKDASGKPVFYRTNNNLIVDKAEVQLHKALFWNKGKNKDQRLYASPMANSSDGEGAEIENAYMSWKPFGDSGRPLADIGFAVTSPVLFMAEGNRKVTITLNFEKSEKTRKILQQLIDKKIPFAKHAFRVKFSGEDSWILPNDKQLADPQNTSHPEISATTKQVLEFVNSATVDCITTKVKDDPSKGYSSVRPGYTIGDIVAERIVETRESIGQFRDLESIRDVHYMGQDKIDDLIYTFSKRVDKTKVDPDNGTITIVRTIDESQPAIVAYNRDVLEEPFITDYPVAKILLNNEIYVNDATGESFPYSYLKDLDLSKIEIIVDVAGVKNNILQNDQGMLDAGKPFKPFGNRPVINSSFYLGNWEVFHKNIDMLSVNIKWHNLPTDSFADYYKYYENTAGDNKSRLRASFKTEISILNQRKWDLIKPSNEALLFDPDSDSAEKSLTMDRDHLAGFNRKLGMSTFDKLDPSTQRGFLRLALKGVDFGHKDYAKAYTAVVLAEVKDAEGDRIIPNEPYTPEISELSVDYRSLEVIDLSNKYDELDEGVDRFFHVYPFGVVEPEHLETENRLLPVFKSEGHLYIGIGKASGGRVLSLLFQMAEGSADPMLDRQPVKWSYLADKSWKTLDSRQIISDSTNQLLTSGIILFDIPKDASVKHTMLPNELLWIKAEVEENSKAIPEIVAIYAQATMAVFENKDNAPSHLSKPLEAHSINKFTIKDAAIKEVSQPFASFGGSMKEQSADFYTRVSERIRHKNRAITIWDYERLILENFPSIHKVKCINHTRFEGALNNYSEFAPGHISIIVVSDMINKNAVDFLKPKTSLIELTEIGDYLNSVKNDFVKLHIKNPLYEEVRVEFNVRFRKGFDAGYYQNRLNEEIKSFLSPWAFSETPDIVFGGRLHKSMIINFVENREYVDYVSCFKMTHAFPQKDAALYKEEETDLAEAKTAASVLGSAMEHVINVLDDDDCACAENKVSAFRSMKTDNCCG